MTNDNEAQGPIRGAAPIALIVFALLFAAFFLRALPLELDGVRTANKADQFDTTRAMDRLTRVLDGKPHPADSDALDTTRTRLLAEITALGYQPELHDEQACRSNAAGSLTRCARVQNITFGIGSGTGPVLLLTAHYDSVEASPGFGDDGIGVAVWLEVAHLLKQAPPARPVLFLITDGEEQALLGAQAFVEKKFYGHEVGRVINLEARGVRGPAMMFETGHPNAGVVADWSKNPARPFSNSMMTAVYELLPNSTDLTVHLHAGLTGINLAISNGLDFYHTAHDDLARLDRRSVQHMGDQALGATQAFLASDWSIDKNPNAEMAYADVVSRGFIGLPQTISTLLLGLCFGLSALLFMRPAKDANWKKPDFVALATPPAIIVASAVIAWASAFIIGRIRPEAGYWVAYSEGLNSVIFLGVLISSALALAYLARKSRPEALYASGWFWFLAVGVGLTLAVPGFSMIFLVPGIVFVLASASAWLLPKWARVFHAIACFFLILIFLPLIKLVEITMGLGLAALFGILEALVIAPSLGLIGPIGTGKRVTLAVLGGTFLGAAIATLILPANSPANPLALNFVAHYDMDEKAGTLLASAPPGALQKDLLKQLSIGEVHVPGVNGEIASRPLDFADRPTAVLTKTDAGYSIAAAGARMVRI
ncbi:MAG TPA: M28 family peptidase, partial [Hyphomonadaceae bacterium]|nr:M28 family peptidase [Hyphomonadaceae bacterium]